MFTLVAAIVWWRRPAVQPNPYIALTVRDLDVGDEAMFRIRAGWGPNSLARSLETMPHVGYNRYIGELMDVFEQRYRAFPDRDNDRNYWVRLLFSQPPQDPVEFSRFRVEFYDAVGKPKLADYFRDSPPMTIRVDEIRWGGVDRDGIAPLRDPEMIPAGAGAYLADTDRVFGISINGEARAYPRRLFGHHEMITDTIGGVAVAAVYCPLCGTMIAYHSKTADGRNFTFGTSGFLYRSNKLMYDAETLSLWQTLSGEPVVGKLVGSGLVLEQSPVVSTTWAEWREANPRTVVMALGKNFAPDPEGLQRYGEGVAYWRYFATDRVMFPVPIEDDRLKNKEEVFAPRLPGGHTPVALSTAFLSKNRVHSLKVGSTELVILTTPAGANRAYHAGDRTFRAGSTPSTIVDQDGRIWTADEDGLRSVGEKVHPRVPGHRAFWFGWHAAFPDTILVK